MQQIDCPLLVLLENFGRSLYCIETGGGVFELTIRRIAGELVQTHTDLWLEGKSLAAKVLSSVRPCLIDLKRVGESRQLRTASKEYLCRSRVHCWRRTALFICP